MFTYDNVDQHNNIVHDAPEKVFLKKELLKKFEDFLSVEGFSVEWESCKNVPYVAKIQNNNLCYSLIMYLKNITGAGWETKPYIKRVQVSNIRNDDIEKYVDTTNQKTNLILGYYNFDNNPLMVAWNAYHYVYHNTVRSCYVTIDNLLEGYKNGFAKTFCSNQEIWVFRPNNFGRFLEDYINKNKILR